MTTVTKSKYQPLTQMRLKGHPVSQQLSSVMPETSIYSCSKMFHWASLETRDSMVGNYLVHWLSTISGTGTKYHNKETEPFTKGHVKTQQLMLN